MRATWIVSAASFISLIASPALAADAHAGHRLAERWCSSCHAIDAAHVGQTPAPSFPGIAARHGQGGTWVRAWLMAPHPSMPDLSLTRAEIDNVVAYLDSLVPPKNK